jgi:hypothetical protein
MKFAKHFSQHTDLLVILGIVLFLTCSLLFTGTISSGFHFTDDHQIYNIEDDLSTSSTLEVASSWIKRDFEWRFRPLYFMHRVFQVKMFGSNFLLWSIYYGILAIIAFTSFYGGMRRLKYSIWESLTFLAVVFVGSQMSVWWRLGTSETIGMVFLGITFYFMTLCLSRKHYLINTILFIVFLIFASLSKESFVIIIPAFIIYKILNEKDFFGISIARTIKKNYLLIIPAFVMFLELIFILLSVGTTFGYAGIDSNIKNMIKGIMEIFEEQSVFLWISIPLIFLYLYVELNEKENRIEKIRILIPSIIFCALVCVPNIILHAKSGIDKRFLLPFTIGVAFFIVTMIKNFTKFSNWQKSLICGVILIVFCGDTGYLYKAYLFSQEGKDTNSFLTAISENATDSTNILLVADPVKTNERSFSIQTYFKHKGIKNLYAHALEQDNYEDWSKDLIPLWHSWFEEKQLENMDTIPRMVVFLDKGLVDDFFKKNILLISEYRPLLKNDSLFEVYRLVE